MKKIITVLLIMAILLSLCGCDASYRSQVSSYNNASEAPQNDVSDSEQYVRSLLRALVAADDINDLESIEIISEKGTAITVNNKDDLKFLEKYTYSHTVPASEFNENNLFTDSKQIDLIINGLECSPLYLLTDGNISVREMCGDSGVSDVPYEIYKADAEYVLNEEGLNELLKN